MSWQSVPLSPQKMPLNMPAPGLGLSLIDTPDLGSGLFPDDDHLELLRAPE